MNEEQDESSVHGFTKIVGMKEMKNQFEFYWDQTVTKEDFLSYATVFEDLFRSYNTEYALAEEALDQRVN